MIKEQANHESRTPVTSSHPPVDTPSEPVDSAAPAPESVAAKPAGVARKAILAIVAGAIVLAAGSKGWASYSFGKTHAETDDAYVTGDLVNISPTVSGTLAELTVEDGDFVHKGQLIARLSNNGSSAELAQAKANLLAAESQVPQAEASLAFTKLSTEAAIRGSQATIATQAAKTQGSRLQVRLSADTIRSQERQAQQQIAAAKAQASQALAAVEGARAGLTSAKQAVETALRNAAAVRSAVDSAKAESDRAAQDLQRYAKLFADEAVSKQQYDSAVAAAATANANLVSTEQRAAAADSQVAQAKSAVTQAEAQVRAMENQAEVAAKQVQVAKEGLQLVRAGETQVGIQGANVETNEGQGQKANADLQSAQAGAQEITLKEKQIATAKAQMLQAKAAVERAQVAVGDAFLYAPCDGYVVKHSANVGTAINPGQTVVTITRGSRVWVMANFKETQLGGVREGQPADVEVDAFPGQKFHGRVGKVIRATGSATTLLPPDNSTGNFTKVVQRVPVKIVFDKDENPGIDRLRQGMSVIATVDTAGRQ
ncbi:HlyD family secretion protein [Fimbriimonas ginsengisoli]|uniref:Secretion protein HlyD family protein n=1 Tax=Fimbriimonas ginsengisoli Gsoil 348 TaxID=661478 RepID=A0A068NLQ7_FIMGI|nr:HlyD family secretion protein [Fimbriimonas ginsengisoli]AIE84411.1 secretion protein HlyD family protein [Fimbriimonas ginsengisoli Gsoil 348]